MAFTTKHPAILKRMEKLAGNGFDVGPALSPEIRSGSGKTLVVRQYFGMGIMEVPADAPEAWFSADVEAPPFRRSPVGPGGSATEEWTAQLFAEAESTYGGSPYAFGGDRVEGRSSGPWDCAGWVMEIFSRIGIDIDPEHMDAFTNAERLRLACEEVTESDVLAGDLEFFRGTYQTPGASHVGIVIDPGACLMYDDHERSDGTGPGKTYYGPGYWRQHLMGFGRVSR